MCIFRFYWDSFLSELRVSLLLHTKTVSHIQGSPKVSDKDREELRRMGEFLRFFKKLLKIDKSRRTWKEYEEWQGMILKFLEGSSKNIQGSKKDSKDST